MQLDAGELRGEMATTGDRHLGLGRLQGGDVLIGIEKVPTRLVGTGLAPGQGRCPPSLADERYQRLFQSASAAPPG